MCNQTTLPLETTLVFANRTLSMKKEDEEEDEEEDEVNQRSIRHNLPLSIRISQYVCS
jgi:hypothetical protein